MTKLQRKVLKYIKEHKGQVSAAEIISEFSNAKEIQEALDFLSEQGYVAAIEEPATSPVQKRRVAA